MSSKKLAHSLQTREIGVRRAHKDLCEWIEEKTVSCLDFQSVRSPPSISSVVTIALDVTDDGYATHVVTRMLITPFVENFCHAVMVTIVFEFLKCLQVGCVIC